MDRLFLRKSQRIVSSQAFSDVLIRKCFVCKGIMRLYVAGNDLAISRFGISVSKSCGNAVIRNQFKRLGREVFRLHQHEIPSGFDYVLIFTQKVPKRKDKSQKPLKGGDCLEFRFDQMESRILGMIDVLKRKGHFGSRKD